VLAAEPDHAQALFGRGRVAVRLGKPEEGLPYLARALELCPGQGLFHEGMGEACLAQGNTEAAKAHFEAAVAADPGLASGWLRLGRMLWAEGATAKAESCFKQAVAHAPFEPSHHFALAEILDETGNRVGAEVRLRKVLALDPIHAEAHARLGEILLANDRPGHAIDHFDQALAGQPDRPDWLCALARTWLAFGDPDMARPALERALELDPQSSEARALRDELRPSGPPDPEDGT